MSRIRRIGSDAEDQAADYLLSLGYTLLGRRQKTRSGELDLVAFDAETLVFVEIKSSARYVAEERLDDLKLKRLGLAAEEYALAHGLNERLMRFDLIVVQTGELKHYKDAFRP